MRETHIQNHCMKNFLLIVLSLCLTSCFTLSRDGWTPKQYYEDARELIDSGSTLIAIDVLNEMQTKFPYGIYTEYAWLEKSHAYLDAGKSALAQIEINEFLRNYPNHEHADYAYFMLAISEQAKFRQFIHLYVNDPAKTHSAPIKKTIEYYRQLISLFPKSQYTPIAQKSVIALTNLLAKQELFIAKNYQTLSAWVAMISRAQYILRNYPTSVYTDEALLLMQEGYQQLGLHRIAKEIGEYYQANKERFAKNNEKI